MMTTGRSRSWIAAGAAAIATALALTGCGSSTPGVAAGGDDASGVESVQFWFKSFSEPENKWYRDTVAQYNASQDEVKVVATEVPGDAWDQKMKAAQAAGKAPDLYTVPGAIAQQVAAGQYHELNGIVSDAALAEIVDEAREVAAVGDTYYAYPMLLEPQVVLYWNKDMLEAAGLDPEVGPRTWDDLFAACEKLQPTLKEGQFCLSTAQDAGDIAWTSWGQQVNATGGLALTDDWSAPNIDSPGYRALAENYKTLWDKGFIPKQPLAHYNVVKDFGEQSVAFKVSGSWMMSEMSVDYPDMLDRVGISPFVSMPGSEGKTTSTLGNYKWVVDAKTKHAEAAGAFVEWALAGDPALLTPYFAQTQFTKVPVRESVRELVNADAAQAGVAWTKVLLDEIAPTAISEPTYPWDVSFAVGTMIETVMKGAASTDDAIRTAEDAIDVVIKRDDLPSHVSQ